MKLHGMEVEGVDACILKEYLEKNYGYNEPIFINEIRLDGLNDNALRQYFKRMLKSGDLARFDMGIVLLSICSIKANDTLPKWEKNMLQL